MRIIQHIGIGLFILSMLIFIASMQLGTYQLTDQILKTANESNYEKVKPDLAFMFDKTYSSNFAFVADLEGAINQLNDGYRKNQEWDQVIYGIKDYVFYLTKHSSTGLVAQNAGLFFLITFITAAFGALLYILPQIQDGPPGIKNNHIFTHAATNAGWIGITVGTFLIVFYIFLYFYPQYIVNWVILVDPISQFLAGTEASQWFLYGFLYTISMLVMGIRMLIKYRHSNYQMIRTTSVMFFQLSFAFIIPNILYALHLPFQDLKNIWPLDYYFFYDWHIKDLIAHGTIGYVMLTWGILLTLVGVPLFTYIFGKRWYCSWVCGCGGLAETLGDPYRQLSDKSLKAWQIERYLIHAVLVFAVLMTLGVIYTYWTAQGSFLGIIDTYKMRDWYGFLIGSIFAGVVGTGFYPFMGNRVWCRFGCPLAAYLGIVQRFQSRFRITTNGGQCISCGNCSTYCEMGIDVRWYAQRGQNIVRSSCVGCGICSAVCPRGVLNLENGPQEGRINDNPILIGNHGIKVLG
ncbi:MAG: 4Fe-4S binding protein [Microscillaceae bacterium]|nr:4Fe-4S binding protein [Microscillaceae bacterium]